MVTSNITLEEAFKEEDSETLIAIKRRFTIINLYLQPMTMEALEDEIVRLLDTKFNY